MTNQEQIENIKQYQNCGYFHPLTCGNDSNHHMLEPVEKDDKIILICPDCDYVQTWVPAVPLMSSLPKFSFWNDTKNEKAKTGN